MRCNARAKSVHGSDYAARDRPLAARPNALDHTGMLPYAIAAAEVNARRAVRWRCTHCSTVTANLLGRRGALVRLLILFGSGVRRFTLRR